MTRHGRWMMGLAVVGAVASVVAISLLWFTITHPVLVAQAIGRGL